MIDNPLASPARLNSGGGGCAHVLSRSPILWNTITEGRNLVMETEISRPNNSNFLSSSFLEIYFSNRGVSYNYDLSCHTLRCYHEAFKELPNGLTVLDYGAGPSILPTISASTKANEIVLSDYADQNCKALQQWLELRGGSWSI